MSIFFNSNLSTSAQSSYANQIYELTGDYTFCNTIFEDDASAFVAYVQGQVMSAVYTHYNTAGICTNVVGAQYCSPRMLVFNQWSVGGVLSNPLPNFPAPSDANLQSYSRMFEDFTILNFTPEISYFLMRAELPPLPGTIDDTWNYLNISRLFNLKVIQDILLDYDPNDPFNNEQTRRYIKFITLEKGFFGMFYYMTPRDYIEGYDDPLI